MKPLTFELVQPLMEDNDWNSFHDAVYNALYVSDDIEVPELTREVLIAIGQRLPAPLLGKAATWSFSDTEVGDNVYEFIEENVEKFGSLAAVLSSSPDEDD